MAGDGVLWSLVDPSRLDILGNFQRGADMAQKQQTETTRRTTLAQLAQGGSYDDAARNLLAAGDLQGATGVAAIAANQGGKPTDEMREYKLAQGQGFTGSFVDYKTALKRAGATNIKNVVNTGDNEYAKVLNKGEAERFLGFQKEGQRATGTLQTLDIMDGLMKDPNFASGLGAERISLPIRQFAAAHGGDPKAAASIETFRALANKSVLDTMGGSLGSGFSNADRDFVVSQVPSLSNTVEGNRQLIQITRQVERRKQEISQLAREYAKRNGGKIDAGFDDVMASYANKYPLFSQSQPQQQQQQLQQPGPQAAPRFDRGTIQQELQRRGVQIQ